jgi:serine/threonine-protein kinase
VIGRTLSHYRIIERIAAGGMGEVYHARDEHLDRDVAVKVLPPGTFADDNAHKRFHREALALSKLNHPHVQTVHDFDRQEGIDFLVTEYVAGKPLDQKLATGPLPEKEVARLGVQLAEGPAAAHKQRLVHRDLKPANLRLTPEGELKILDFGLAKLARSVDETTTGGDRATESWVTDAVVGTLPYMSPEQLRGDGVDARSDIYATGVVLYEMATGQRPFREKLSTALADAILHQPPPPPGRVRPAVSPRLEEVILKCLEKEPERRYQSATELRVDLERLRAPAMQAVPPRRRWTPRAWALAAVLSALVLLLLLIALSIGGLKERLAGGSAPGPITSIAVLPLANLSGDPEQEYFADGMTEALITDLAKIGALKVISRTSVMQYKDARKPLPEIARELGVAAVVEGSVLRAGNQVRITAQLIHATTDEHLWAESYDRDLRDVLALQSEVARAIAGEIKIAVTVEEESRLATAPSVNPEAYEAYLKGRYHWNKRTPESVGKGLAFFEQAISIDPTYAVAYAGVADSLIIESASYLGLSPEEILRRATAATTKALELDDALAEAHASLAVIRSTRYWDWTGAEGEYQRAIELSPSYSTARQWYAEFLSFALRHEEAIAHIKRARETDPTSLVIHAAEGRLLVYAGRLDEGIERLQKTLELDPGFFLAHAALGRAYLRRGMGEQAVATFQRAEIKALLGHAYGVTGRKVEAENILGELKRLWEQGYAPATDVAKVYAGLRETDQAFAWLEKAYEARDPNLIMIHVEPEYDSLRADSRYPSLLRRLNFPE